jgi:deferrochelatase/peroxidase EfeB
MPRPTPISPRAIDRRGFLGGVLGAGIAVPLAAAAIALDPEPAVAGQPAAASASTAGAHESYAFHGAHQSGILTPKQADAAFVALDVTAASRGELQALLRELTDRVRFLTSGGTPPELGLVAPPADSGVLGPDVVPDGLTVTLGVGASLFDDRFGLSTVKPARLITMQDFPNDALQREVCDGDLMLQVCANSRDTVLHAVRDIARATRGGMQVRWRQDGFASPPRPSGTPRNLLGFKDGTGNPSTNSARSMDELVWTRAGGDEPAWVSGGSYQAVRVIRMLVEFWDRVSIHEQENIFGRRRDSGAPLTGTTEFARPDYVMDPTGDVIQMDAHIRLANPHTAATANQQMLRRAYNYDAGIDANGNLDMGLIFACFNQDLQRQFIGVQKRLVDEPLVDYISPFGGGYYFSLPGVTNSRDWLGRSMLA